MKKTVEKKNRGYRSKGYIIRNLVTFIAVVNLALLFVFDYNVPGLSYVMGKIENKRDHVEGVDETSVDASTGDIIFEYDNDKFVYNGKGKFDPMKDVIIKDQEGNELSKDFLTAEVTGEKDKEIVYTYEDEDGLSGKDTRELKLEDYSAPEITLSEEVPVILDDNLGKLKKHCKGIYSATDGFGNDITDDVEIAATPIKEYNGVFTVEFSVTNIFGDTAQAEDDALTDFQKPHLKLKTEKLELKRGKAFDANSYIKFAVDWNGKNITDLVEIDGEVDTQTLGTYKVKYDLTNEDGQHVNTRKLTVHVVE